MDTAEIAEQVIHLSIDQWNRSFGGTSALDIRSKLGVSNEEVMRAMEVLVGENKGTINENVKLFEVSFDPANPSFEMPKEAITTHVFFPSKDLLEKHFYSTDLAKQGHPEYRARLHRGENQMQLCFFSAEVLARYFDHPELYGINDSMSGGEICSNSDADEDRSLYVRYGKKVMANGEAAITALFKDLYVMSDKEQRHWHAHERIDDGDDKTDVNFLRFLARTYEGSFVDYKDPLGTLMETLRQINDQIPIFRNTENVHLRIPVENTEKSFVDSCSELYKIVGADSLNQISLKGLLSESLGVDDTEFVHEESGRPLSPVQLLELTEGKLEINNLLSVSIKKVNKLRIAADHKIIKPQADDINYVGQFLALCEEITNAGKYFKSNL